MQATQISALRWKTSARRYAHKQLTMTVLLTVEMSCRDTRPVPAQPLSHQVTLSLPIKPHASYEPMQCASTLDPKICPECRREFDAVVSVPDPLKKPMKWFHLVDHDQVTTLLQVNKIGYFCCGSAYTLPFSEDVPSSVLCAAYVTVALATHYNPTHAGDESPHSPLSDYLFRKVRVVWSCLAGQTHLRRMHSGCDAHLRLAARGKIQMVFTGAFWPKQNETHRLFLKKRTESWERWESESREGSRPSIARCDRVMRIALRH